MRGLAALFWVLAVVAGFGAAAWGAQYLFLRPPSFDAFLTRTFWRFALQDPEALTRMRLLERWGLDFHNDDLTDASPAHQEQLMALREDTLAVLLSYDRSTLDARRQVAYDALRWDLETVLQGRRCLLHDFPVNPVDGVQLSLPAFLLHAHRVATLDDARNYVIRLSRVGRKIDQTIEALRQRESLGIRPPRFLIERVLDQMRAFIAPPPAEHPLVTSLADRIDRLDDVPEVLREALLADAAYEVEHVVYPAWQRLIRHFEPLRYRTLTDDGMWARPGGEECYRWMILRHTTLPLSPDELHRLGLARVRQIERRLDELLAQQGWRSGSVAERLSALEASGQSSASSAEREALLAEAQRLATQTRAALAPLFRHWPEQMPRFFAAPLLPGQRAPLAWYRPPTLDGGTDGTVFVNFDAGYRLPPWALRTLVHHEGLPGHHLQLGLQATSSSLPLLMRTAHFAGFVEGWAVYAEHLAAERGLLDEPMERIGLLREELLRAARLVADTGIHHRRWSRAEAQAWLRATVGRSDAEVEAEIDRYLVMPGQALSYAVGGLRLLKLREDAQRALGARFDLAGFHEAILAHGAVPLPVLDEVVRRHVAGR